MMMMIMMMMMMMMMINFLSRTMVVLSTLEG